MHHYEGILLSKIPYRDRDIIARFLLRHGQVATFLFYGGQGGGKKRKGSFLELGYALSIKAKPFRNKKEEFITAGEWKILWAHEQIRYDHQAYFLLGLFLEVTLKLSPTFIREEENFNAEEGSYQDLYRVLSNALFFLEDSLGKKQFQWKNHLFLFLYKTIEGIGLNPQIENCYYSETKLEKHHALVFLEEEGHFALKNYTSQHEREDSHDLWMALKAIEGLPYKDYARLNLSQGHLGKKLLSYLGHHHNWKKLAAEKFLFQERN